MTVRRPVYLDGTSIRDMTDAQITAIQQRCVYLFGGSNRSVNLSYTAGNAGNLNRMIDSRDTAGSEANNSTSFGNNSPGGVTDRGADTTYDYITVSYTHLTLPTKA